MNRAQEKLRQAALKADAAYSTELTRVYGTKSGDARYKYTHADKAVDAAMRAKLAADRDWWAACVAGELRMSGERL